MGQNNTPSPSDDIINRALRRIPDTKSDDTNNKRSDNQLSSFEKQLLSIPIELHSAITTLLSNGDIKNLRLVSSTFRFVFQLGVNRVILSANSLNIEVLHSIADDEDFRYRVREIVWDDGRIQSKSDAYGRMLVIHPEIDHLGIPRYYHGQYLHNKIEITNRLRGNRVMPPQDCWMLDQPRYEDQVEVLNHKRDIEALRYAIKRFPGLRKLTLIPTSYEERTGLVIYPSPLSRSLPYNYVYPRSYTWPGCGYDDIMSKALPWRKELDVNWLQRIDMASTQQHYHLLNMKQPREEEYREKWRGLRVILALLAEKNINHNISEFAIDTDRYRTGIHHQILTLPCIENTQLQNLLSTPGFRKLNLALFTGDYQELNWASFRDGLAYKTLKMAKDLEELIISFGVGAARSRPIPIITQYSLSPLNQVIPVDCWTRLRRLSISRCYLDEDDIVGFLLRLPASVSSIELRFIYFMNPSEGHWSLLEKMRTQLPWRDWASDQRPRLGIAVSVKRGCWFSVGRYVWLEKVLERFLYQNGENPFSDIPVWSSEVKLRCGGILKDLSDLEFGVPYDEEVYVVCKHERWT